MFEHAQSGVFRTASSSHGSPNDFYMKSEQITSAGEDLSSSVDLSVRLTDFGTGASPTFTSKDARLWF